MWIGLMVFGFWLHGCIVCHNRVSDMFVDAEKEYKLFLWIHVLLSWFGNMRLMKIELEAMNDVIIELIDKLKEYEQSSNV